MTIKKVVKKTGLNPQTIRYYEKLGLISPSRNPENSYRIYSERDVDLILLIKKLQSLRFTLKEIKDFIKLLDKQNSCKRFEEFLKSHIDKINFQMEELVKLKNTLNHYYDLCTKNPQKNHCISIKELNNH